MDSIWDRPTAKPEPSRLAGFSPPPWSALGRRGIAPREPQAPWRESDNVEDRRSPTFGQWLSALGSQVANMPALVMRDISAAGASPASDEMMQKHMDDASDLLPESRVEPTGRQLPIYYMPRADGGSVDVDVPWRLTSDTQPETLALYEKVRAELHRRGIPSAMWPTYEEFITRLSA